MLNNVVLVGRLVQTPELVDTENGLKVSFITLAVPRSYKNQDGEYDADFLDCTLWTAIAENTAEYCKTGDLIGVKGRLQSRIIENEDGSKFKKMEIIAERVTFLSSKGVKTNENSDSVTEVVDEEKNDELVNEVKEEEKKYGKKGKKK